MITNTVILLYCELAPALVKGIIGIVIERTNFKYPLSEWSINPRVW